MSHVVNDPNIRPAALPVRAEFIPEELRAVPQWVNWQWTWKADKEKWTKPPVYVNGQVQNASSTNPRTWTTFETAERHYRERGDLDGVGFVLCTGGGHVGLDLDNCRDAQGQIAAWATTIIEAARSYTEVSPTGLGVRVILRGTLPPGARKQGDREAYAAERYLTLTGHRVPGTPAAIRVLSDRDAVELHALVFPPAPEATRRTSSSSAASSHNLDDAELIERIRRSKQADLFGRLYDHGDLSGHRNDASAADEALCSVLLWWTAGDLVQADRIFRASALMRDKWDSPRGDSTYGQNTLRRVVPRDGGYQPGGTGTMPPRDRESTPRGDVSPDDDEPDAAQPQTPERCPFELNDTGNARRLVALHGEAIRYVVDQDQWLVWCGTRWRRDENDVELLRRTRSVSEAIDAEVLVCADDDRRKVLRRWATTSGEEPRRRRMIELARAEPEVCTRGSELDADPWALNVANGTIDLRTGSLRPHRRDDLITKLAPVTYDPAARSQVFEDFLGRVLPELSVRAFVQRCTGYGVTGVTRDEKWFLAHGPTAGGKSTFLEAQRNMLGDYAATISSEAFMRRRDGGNATPEVARLEGVRFATAYEVTAGRVVDEGLLKTFTGGDRVVARELYKQPVSFVPAAKLFVATNDRPKIRDDDDAMWRRVLELPFTVSIPEAEQDPAVKAELTDVTRSGSATLAWAIEGCLAWQREGLNPPEGVRRATADYRSEMDLVGQFLEDCCTFVYDAWTSTERLVEAYARWADANGLKPYSGRELGRRLGRHGLRAEANQATHTKERGWRGVALGDRS